jgi:arginine exporter protein ArgO
LVAVTAVAALGVGIAAGLGVAVPLGAIGVLLLEEGLNRGWRRAVPAATAVACVDVAYCVVAILLGTFAAPAIDQLGFWLEVIGALVLLVVAAMGITRGLRPSAEPAFTSPHQLDRSRFALFVGLTAINPATLVYFAAVAATMTQSLRAVSAVVLVGGVGLASLFWQLLLVAAGAFLGSRANARARRITVLAGNLVVAAFGAAILLRVYV